MKKLGIFLTLILLLTATSAGASGLGYGPNIKVRESTSTNWSGYAVETNLLNPANYVVTDVKGTWTVPTVSASTTNSYSSVWVGIDGYSSNTVEQIGTEEDWINGTAVYYAWYEMYPKPARLIGSLAISPGDQMSAEVKYIGPGYFTLTLSDVTKGTSFGTIQKLKSAKRQSAEWIVEAPFSGGTLPLANFGTVTFTNASTTINGVTGSINNSNWQYDPITMVSSGGTSLATPGALSTDGTSFTVTRK